MKSNSDQMKSIRSLKRKIDECDEAIDHAEDLKKQKIALEKELKDLKMDLIKEKKIKWVQMSFQHWMEETEYQTFYIWYIGNKYEYGVWEGEDKLNEDEYQHFKDFYKDYFYYECPIYCEYDEMTEMEHAFEDGDAKISEVFRDSL